MISKDREYRSMPVMLPVPEVRRDEPDAEKRYLVEGYASTFEPYVLFEDEAGNEYREQIDPKAFDGADMTDVIFLYNHEGQVMARQKNGSLELLVDDHGLKVRADLGGSERGRQMYEEIKSGLIDQMSFAFTVEDEEYDRKTRTRTIHRMKKLYDVSAVSMPANPGTDINARSATWVDGVISQERAERLEAEKREKLKLKIQIQLELGGKQA